MVKIKILQLIGGDVHPLNVQQALMFLEIEASTPEETKGLCEDPQTHTVHIDEVIRALTENGRDDIVKYFEKIKHEKSIVAIPFPRRSFELLPKEINA